MPGRRSRPTGGGPILICEDDPMVSAYLQDALQQAGYRTAAVPDGESALRLALELRPAAIVLDLALPGLDGATVLTRLKADPRTAAIPVVVASAYPGWLTFLDRGHAAAVLEKPCLPEELEAAVARALAPPAAEPRGGRPGRRSWGASRPSRWSSNARPS